MVALLRHHLNVRFNLLSVPIEILTIEADGIAGELGLDDRHYELPPTEYVQSRDYRADTHGFKAGAQPTRPPHSSVPFPQEWGEQRLRR